MMEHPEWRNNLGRPDVPFAFPSPPQPAFLSQFKPGIAELNNVDAALPVADVS
jgi:hypothetical protein